MPPARWQHRPVLSQCLLPSMAAEQPEKNGSRRLVRSAYPAAPIGAFSRCLRVLVPSFHSTPLTRWNHLTAGGGIHWDQAGDQEQGENPPTCKYQQADLCVHTWKKYLSRYPHSSALHLCFGAILLVSSDPALSLISPTSLTSLLAFPSIVL